MTQRSEFDFEDLDVFARSLDAVAAVEHVAGALPDGRAYVRDQRRRAANSMPLNIADGAGEFSPSEKARFYRIAKRSALHRVVGMLIVMIRRCADRAARVETARRA